MLVYKDRAVNFQLHKSSFDEVLKRLQLREMNATFIKHIIFAGVFIGVTVQRS